VKIGITGWRGFIGTHLLDRIKKAVLFTGDMCQLADVMDFIQGLDVIYHLAGKNRGDAGTILSNNLVGTANLVLATKALRVSPLIVFASSTQVQSAPNSEYGMVKLIEEKIVRKADKWCIFRIPNVYGEGCKPFYNSVVAIFAYQLTHGQSVTISNPATTREFIYIDDLVAELLNPLNHEIISPTGETLSIGQVYDFMTSKLGEHDNLKKCLYYYKGIDLAKG
jgi:UDP-2-acetamido-2,6-beta-L-arabino-hexul-4-ose reductase